MKPAGQCLTVYAPAKINTSLRVLGRRGDGYHELVSRFCGVGLFDVVSVRARCDSQMTLAVCGGPVDVPPDRSNLVMAAARRVRTAAANATGGRPEAPGEGIGFDLSLFKAIPSQAGLGGGSSDAAAAILAISRLLGFRDERELHRVADELGSDVNFFFSGHQSAICHGRGEQVGPPVSPPAVAFVLARPDFGIPTAAVFRTHAKLRENLAEPAGNALDSGATEIRPDGYNELQTAAKACSPRFADWLMRLDATCGGTGDWTMSGSGSTVFRAFGTYSRAIRAAAVVRARVGCWVRVARPATRHVVADLWLDPPHADRRTVQ